MCLATACQSSPWRCAASLQMPAKAIKAGCSIGVSFISEQPLFKAYLPVASGKCIFAYAGAQIERRQVYVNRVFRSDNDIRMQVVTSAEQFMHAIAIRAICFMEDTGLTADQAIDGNDYQATHILAYAKQEPIGATRICWFRDFAKIERTAFRPAYRSARVLKLCSHFIFDHVARKGYQLLVTHAEPKYARVWELVLVSSASTGARPSLPKDTSLISSLSKGCRLRPTPSRYKPIRRCCFGSKDNGTSRARSRPAMAKLSRVNRRSRSVCRVCWSCVIASRMCSDQDGRCSNQDGR